MINTVKRFISRFTKKSIRYKVGVTCDENASFKKPPTKEQKEKAWRAMRPVYRVKDREQIGDFEVDGLSVRNGVKVMKLKHTLTGEVFSFPMSLFEILFEVIPRK